MRGNEGQTQLSPNFAGRTTNQISNETMKRMPLPTSSSQSPGTSPMPDLLWISKQQQQHPSLHAHPLKNTIRVNSSGLRYKFDGKQWRPLCESPDGYECRNLVFRSSLCQKHFYKVNLFKRPYIKNGSVPPFPLKRPASDSYEHNDIENDDSIEVLENSDPMMIKQDQIELQNESQPEFTFFTIDCDSQSDFDKHESNPCKSTSLPKMRRLDSTNNESITFNELEPTSLSLSIPKVTESIRLGLPPLTRTEEKSIANELITQLSADASLTMAEQLARHRACGIVMDNYSQQLSSANISSEWFYDFLLRNPRVPIHFQTWFSSVKPTLPSSDLTIDIKLWELGLVTRSVIPSSSLSSSSSSP